MLGLARDDGVHRGPVSVTVEAFILAYARWCDAREVVRDEDERNVGVRVSFGTRVLVDANTIAVWDALIGATDEEPHDET